MKNLLVVLFVVTLGVMVEAQVPPWMDDDVPDGVMWGIGIAKQSSLSHSKTMSENRARQSIASELDSLVQSEIQDYNQDTGNEENRVSVEFAQNVSRTVSSARLIGSKVMKQWVAPDGTYWCRLQYSKEEAKRWTQEILKNKGEETFDDGKIANEVASSIDSSREVKVTQ
jgi:hypothetical protein